MSYQLKHFLLTICFICFFKTLKVFLNESLCLLPKVKTKHLVNLSMTASLQNLKIFNQSLFVLETLEEFADSLQISFFSELMATFRDSFIQFCQKVLEQKENLDVYLLKL